MTITHFEHLLPFERVQALNQHAVFLAQRKTANGRIYLYAVNGFYVELLLDPPGPQKRDFRIHGVFGDTECLAVYLEGVDITEFQY
jgi:hypothetical protein